MSSSRRPCSPPRSSCSPTTSPSTAAPTWTSRATWRRASPSSDDGAPGRSPGRGRRTPLFAGGHRHQGDRRAAPQDRRLPFRDRGGRPLPALPAEALRPRAGLLRGERVLRRLPHDLRGRHQVDDGGQRGLPPVQRRRVGLPARAARGGRAPPCARCARDRGRARRHGALLRRQARGARACGRRGGGRLGRLLCRARAAAPPRAWGKRGGGGHLGQRAGGRGAGAARAPRPGGRRPLGRDPRPARHDPDRGGTGPLPARARARARDAGGAGHPARADREPALGASRPRRGAERLRRGGRGGRPGRDCPAGARRARRAPRPRGTGPTPRCRPRLCSEGWAPPGTPSIIPKGGVPPPPGPDAPPGDIGGRGPVFPPRAGRGGVRVRAGQTEGAVALARLAGFAPAGVICEILREDGTMARLPDLEEFAARHDLKIATIAELIEYRSRHDSLVHRTAEARITTRHGGDFRALVYTTDVDEGEHLVLAKGDIRADEPTLVRTHLEYLPGDVFGYRERDTRSLLQKAMERIAAEGKGVILYLRRDARGLDLFSEPRTDSARAPTTAPRAPWLPHLLRCRARPQ